MPGISPESADGGLLCMPFVSICFESSETVQSEDRRSSQERHGLISLTHQRALRWSD